MRRYLALLTLVIIFVWNQKFQQKPVPKRTPEASPIQQASPVKKVETPRIKKESRKPASRSKKNQDKSMLPQDLTHTLTPHPSITLPGGMFLTQDIGAIAKTQWQESLGELVWQDQELVYFKGKSKESSPTAYSPGRRRFYPISSVLKIRHTDEVLRQDLREQGFQEYHYHSKLKLLFLQTSASETLRVYEELKAQGHQVELEVLIERPEAH